MAWNISDLDKNKTESCIQNENIRLDNCREVLCKLKKEYESKRYKYMTKLSDIEDKITTLEASISSGEKFVSDCEKHLKELETKWK